MTRHETQVLRGVGIAEVVAPRTGVSAGSAERIRQKPPVTGPNEGGPGGEPVTPRGERGRLTDRRVRGGRYKICAALTRPTTGRARALRGDPTPAVRASAADGALGVRLRSQPSPFADASATPAVVSQEIILCGR
jgi:hypothetical protein